MFLAGCLSFDWYSAVRLDIGPVLASHLFSATYPFISSLLIANFFRPLISFGHPSLLATHLFWPLISFGHSSLLTNHLFYAFIPFDQNGHHFDCDWRLRLTPAV